MGVDEEKMAFNARAKASMDQYLRSRSWVEKVESIERMNEAAKIARAAMKEALVSQAVRSIRDSLDKA